MRRILGLLAATTVLTACPQDPVRVGFNMSDYFGVDQGREYVYTNMDEELDYRIRGILDPRRLDNPETPAGIEGMDAVRISYAKECNEGVEECGAGPLYDLFMDDNDTEGVVIRGYENPSAGRVVFETPLVLAKPKFGRGDAVVTADVDGHTFTSRFFDLEEDGTVLPDGSEIPAELGCDQDLDVSWECAHFVVESDPPGHWLAGDWWAAPGYHIVAWNRTEDGGKWRVLDADPYTPPDEPDDTDATDDTDS